MPEISRFLGIVIGMYYNDHEPPHFHAIYGSYEASISIENGRIIEGNLPSRALMHVVEWWKQHKLELAENWKRCRLHQATQKIEPLE